MGSKRKKKKTCIYRRDAVRDNKAKNTSVLGGPDEENTVKTEVSSTCLNCIAKGRLYSQRLGDFHSCQDTSTFCVQRYNQPGQSKLNVFPSYGSKHIPAYEIR